MFYGLLDLALVIALMLACRQEVAATFRGLARLLGKPAPRSRRTADRADQRMVLMLAVGLVPLVLDIALWFWSPALYRKPLVWAVLLILGGLVLYRFAYLTRGAKDEKQMELSDAMLVGFGQAAALLPGLSRTGLMLAIGQGRGFQPVFALRFALLLSIPYLFGSGVIRIVRGLILGVQAASIPAYLVGMAVCVLAALAGVHLLQQSVARRRVNLYAFYCWGAAAFSAFLFLIT